MTLGGDGIIGWRRSALLLPALVLAACLYTLGQSAAQAQLFSDRPPPVPPASVPDPGGAVSLAPPSGPGAAPPSLPPTLTQPNTPSMPPPAVTRDRKSTRLNSSHLVISYAVFCLKKKKNHEPIRSVVTPLPLPLSLVHVLLD